MADILALSADERLQLVQEIWDSLANSPEAAPLTESQRQELDARLDAHRRDPAKGSPWAEVKARVLNGL